MNEIVKDLGDGAVAYTAESGEVIKFFHVGTITCGGKWYAFFQPGEKLDGIDPDELLIYEIRGEGKNEELLPVTDEQTIERVYAAFIKELEDEDDGDNGESQSGCGGCCGYATKRETCGSSTVCGKCKK